MFGNKKAVTPSDAEPSPTDVMVKKLLEEGTDLPLLPPEDGLMEAQIREWNALILWVDGRIKAAEQRIYNAIIAGMTDSEEAE